MYVRLRAQALADYNRSCHSTIIALVALAMTDLSRGKRIHIVDEVYLNDIRVDHCDVLRTWRLALRLEDPNEYTDLKAQLPFFYGCETIDELILRALEGADEVV